MQPNISLTSQWVLITGGAGYIGSHMVKLCLQAGLNVVVIDDLSQGHRDAVLTEHFVQGDMGDRTCLNALFQTYPITAVMHFAGVSCVADSLISPQRYFDNNLEKPKVLLEVMLSFGVTRFIYSSTAAVYGETNGMPVDEASVCEPINPYGRSKYAFERACAPLSSIIFRYFNAAGADPDGVLSERHDPETHLIPSVLRALHTHQPVYVYGHDYPTPDGSCVRDYVHVWDICQAHLLALERLFTTETVLHEVYNLGSERGYSVREVLRVIERVTGLSIAYALASRREGDPPYLVACARKAKQVLGWQPRYASLEDMVRTVTRAQQIFNECA